MIVVLFPVVVVSLFVFGALNVFGLVTFGAFYMWALVRAARSQRWDSHVR